MVRWEGEAMKVIYYQDNKVIMLDQRLLPHKEIYREFEDHQGVAEAIKEMVIRGAPAIGVAGAYGMAIGAKNLKTDNFSDFLKKLKQIGAGLAYARPTAVNLSWAVKRMIKKAKNLHGKSIDEIKDELLKEAFKIHQETYETDRKIGQFGATLIKDGDTILTHCNAGMLATAGYGTAIGVIKSAYETKKRIYVFVDETRPFLQGARLTAYELKEAKIPFALICDNMAGYYMSNGYINLVIVGADRIAKNGDTANKIGTLTLAILAKYYKIPFYVAAPLSTVDLTAISWRDILIEQRDPKEVSHICGIPIAPDNIEIYNPAFDVTPHRLITAIITEKGIIYPPYTKSLKEAFRH